MKSTIATIIEACTKQILNDPLISSIPPQWPREANSFKSHRVGQVSNIRAEGAVVKSHDVNSIAPTTAIQ